MDHRTRVWTSSGSGLGVITAGKNLTKYSHISTFKVITEPSCTLISLYTSPSCDYLCSKLKEHHFHKQDEKSSISALWTPPACLCLGVYSHIPWSVFSPCLFIITARSVCAETFVTFLEKLNHDHPLSACTDSLQEQQLTRRRRGPRGWWSRVEWASVEGGWEGFQIRQNLMTEKRKWHMHNFLYWQRSSGGKT